MSKAVANKGSRWSLDFTAKGRDRNTELPAPPGYSLSFNQSSEVNKANDASLVIKRAWDLALSPLKQVRSRPIVGGQRGLGVVDICARVMG